MEIVSECERLHLLDDESFASEFVASRHRSKGHGPTRLRSDLMKKGVAQETIDKAMDNLDPERVGERAEEVLRKKWKAYRKLEPGKRATKESDIVSAQAGLHIRNCCRGI